MRKSSSNYRILPKRAKKLNKNFQKALINHRKKMSTNKLCSFVDIHPAVLGRMIIGSIGRNPADPRIYKLAEFIGYKGKIFVD